MLGRYITPPLDAGLPRVVEETTLLQKLADLGFQVSVELVSLPTFNHLMIVKVQHSHSVCMLRSFQVTLWAKTKSLYTVKKVEQPLWFCHTLRVLKYVGNKVL